MFSLRTLKPSSSNVLMFSKHSKSAISNSGSFKLLLSGWPLFSSATRDTTDSFVIWEQWKLKSWLLTIYLIHPEDPEIERWRAVRLEHAWMRSPRSWDLCHSPQLEGSWICKLVMWGMIEIEWAADSPINLSSSGHDRQNREKMAGLDYGSVLAFWCK